jgi:hypothetical protein
MILCVLVSSPDLSLHLVQMAALKIHLRKDQTIPNPHQNLVESLKPLVVVCVCNILL